VTCVISIESNFRVSRICKTEYNVSIRIIPITILPPVFSLFSESLTISLVSPPVPPIKITSAISKSDIFSLAFPKSTETFERLNFFKFFLVNC